MSFQLSQAHLGGLHVNYGEVMKSLQFRSFMILFLQLILLLSTHTALAEGTVTLGLTSYQQEYVLHEPVHFTGTLVNNSERDILIYGMEKYNENMECTFLEVESADGSVTKRRTNYYHDHAIRSPYYVGQMLKPGDTFTFDIFPNRTRSIVNIKDGGWTFPEHGMYKVRLAYVVEDFRKVLWKPEGDALYSNQITLHIKPPSTVEKEILDAYWDGISLEWDGKIISGFNKSKLEQVLVKHPNESLIKYIHFALLNASFTIDGTDFQMAFMHAQHLMDNYPEFRSGQVRSTLAAFLNLAGRRDEAVGLLEEALSIRPELKDDFYFMILKFTAETGDSRAFYRWLRKRSKDVNIKNYKMN